MIKKKQLKERKPKSDKKISEVKCWGTNLKKKIKKRIKKAVFKRMSIVFNIKIK